MRSAVSGPAFRRRFLTCLECVYTIMYAEVNRKMNYEQAEIRKDKSYRNLCDIIVSSDRCIPAVI